MKNCLFILSLLLPVSCFGQGTLQRVQKFCEDGNQVVITQGLNSTTKVQKSFPQCTVTVYFSGTSTLAPVFMDNLLSPHPLANPFTANTDGSFGFYAAPSACYDVVTSGAGFPSPFTYAYICLGGGSGGGGVNPGTPYQVTRYDPTGLNIQNSSGSDNPANTFTQWPNGLTVMGNALGLIYPNSPNGTAIQLLACIDPTVTSVSEVTTCPAGTNKAVGLVHFGGGISGNAQVSQIGFDTCIFDGQTLIGDYAGPSSTTAGVCADIGASPSAAFQRIGRITTLNSGSGTASTMQLGPWDLFAPGGGGGSGTVGVCNTANSNAVFILAGNKVDCDPFVTDIAGTMTMFSLGLVDPNHAGFYYQKQGPLPPTTPANSVAEYPPTSVTAYAEKRPGAVGTVGQTRVISSIGADGGGNPIAIEAWGTAGGPAFAQAADPTAPTLTPTNPGTTNYTYGVAGCEDPGCTRHSALVTTATTTGNATLNGSNPILLSAYADTLYGYRFYVICRTVATGSPASVGVIASGAWKQYSDNGITADGSNCATTYATNNTKLDDHCLGANPSIANAALSVPCGIDTPPASPKALNDEFTAGGAGSPGDSNNPFWVWRNQGTSTATLTNGELIFIPQPGSGADSFRLLTQTSPSTPWTFVTAALPLFTQGSNNQLLGMCVGDGTKFESWTEKTVSNGELEVDRWTNTTTFSANQYGLTIIGAAYPWTWFKLQNDGTNLNFSHSFDGINYFQDYTEAKGAFLGTITEIGVCGESTSTAATPQLSVDYFRETQ